MIALAPTRRPPWQLQGLTRVRSDANADATAPAFVHFSAFSQPGALTLTATPASVLSPQCCEWMWPATDLRPACADTMARPEAAALRDARLARVPAQDGATQLSKGDASGRAAVYLSPISTLESAWSPAPGSGEPARDAATPEARTPAEAHCGTLACAAMASAARTPAGAEQGGARGSWGGDAHRGGGAARPRPRPPLHNPSRCPSPGRARPRCRARAAAVSRSSSLNDEKARRPRASICGCG